MKKLITIITLVVALATSVTAEPPAKLLRWFNENHPEVAAVYRQEFNHYKQELEAYKEARRKLIDEMDDYSDSLISKNIEPIVRKYYKKTLSSEEFKKLEELFKHGDSKIPWCKYAAVHLPYGPTSTTDVELFKNEVNLRLAEVTLKVNKKFLPKFDELGEMPTCPELPFRWSKMPHGGVLWNYEIVTIGNTQYAIESDWVKEVK